MDMADYLCVTINQVCDVVQLGKKKPTKITTGQGSPSSSFIVKDFKCETIFERQMLICLWQWEQHKTFFFLKLLHLWCAEGHKTLSCANHIFQGCAEADL